MLHLCSQIQPNGTGGAVASAGVFFKDLSLPEYAKSDLLKGGGVKSDYVLICYGDTPAVQASELKAFQDLCLTNHAHMGVLGIQVPNPTGYGRLVIDQDENLVKIIEETDASPEEKKITLCNSGVIFAQTLVLFELLQKLENKNKQNEFYLTDCVQLAVQKGYKVCVYDSKNWKDFLGVNDPSQMEDMKKYLSHTRG